MFLFLKLYLAHLLGDFLFQFDELYKLKIKNITGHFYHALMHALLSALLIFPYLDQPFAWILIFLLADIHMFQDYLKYRWKGPRQWVFPLFVLDQFFHLFWIAAVLLLPISRKIPDLPATFWFQIYLNPSLTLFVIVWLFATVVGSYTLHNFSASYSRCHRKDRFISRIELVHGGFERTLILLIVIVSPHPAFWLLTPLVGLIRFPIVLLRNKMDFLASLAYALTLGLLFRNFF